MVRFHFVVLSLSRPQAPGEYKAWYLHFALTQAAHMMSTSNTKTHLELPTTPARSVRDLQLTGVTKRGLRGLVLEVVLTDQAKVPTL